MTGGHSWAERDGRTLIHLNRIGFRVDGAAGSRDPRGMAAGRLSADLHTVAADEALLRNLMLVVERCYLSVRALIATPYASALAATSEEERRLGVTCIDIGGGTATVAAFADGHFIHAATIAVGGLLTSAWRECGRPCGSRQSRRLWHNDRCPIRRARGVFVSWPARRRGRGQTTRRTWPASLSAHGQYSGSA
jgi:hypothetical protein